MKHKILFTLTLVAALLPPALRADESNKWTFDVTLYGLAAGMSGDVTVRGVPADVNVGFVKIWDNLEFGAMGKVSVGYERWAVTTDVIYMGLGASKNGVSADMNQWLVEPTLSYAFCKEFELLAGTRYNNLNGEIRGPFGRNPTGTQAWWDPIVGTNLRLPLGKKFSFNVRGDIGGFGVGSELTWQAFPYFSWQFAKWGSLQAGYRWIYADYTTGSGASKFKYDMLVQGPQIGFTVHF
jgi:hypothetical protein